MTLTAERDTGDQALLEPVEGQTDLPIENRLPIDRRGTDAPSPVNPARPKQAAERIDKPVAVRGAGGRFVSQLGCRSSPSR
jgi:hypothetical protein